MNSSNQKQSRWVEPDRVYLNEKPGFSILNFFASMVFLGVTLGLVFPYMI